jgi:hypothetical protein
MRQVLLPLTTIAYTLQYVDRSAMRCAPRSLIPARRADVVATPRSSPFGPTCTSLRTSTRGLAACTTSATSPSSSQEGE